MEIGRGKVGATATRPVQEDFLSVLVAQANTVASRFGHRGSGLSSIDKFVSPEFLAVWARRDSLHWYQI